MNDSCSRCSSDEIEDYREDIDDWIEGEDLGRPSDPVVKAFGIPI